MAFLLLHNYTDFIRHYIDLEVGRVDPLLSTVVKIAAATGIDLNSIVREYAASEEILKR